MEVGNGFAGFGDLEKALTEIHDMSDVEVEDLKNGLKSDVLPVQERPDLQTYRQEQLREKTRLRNQSLSRFDRFRLWASRLVGDGKQQKRQYTLRRAKRLHTQFDTGYKQLEKEHEELLSSFEKVSALHVKSQAYFQACVHSYKKKQEKVDRLEAEVEELENGSKGHLATVLFEQRERLMNERRNLLRLENDTNTAMQFYQGNKDRYSYLKEQIGSVQNDIAMLYSQKSALESVIDQERRNALLTVGDRIPALRDLYEEIGIIAQSLEGAEHLAETGNSSLDETYRITPTSKQFDPLVEQWTKIKKS